MPENIFICVIRLHLEVRPDKCVSLAALDVVLYAKD